MPALQLDVDSQGERQGVKPTVAELIERYIVEMNPIKPIGQSQMYGLRRLQRAPIGAKAAPDLKPSDIIDHCRWRKTTKDAKGKTPAPATVMQDITILRGPLGYATLGWDMPDVSVAPIVAAMPMLRKYNIIGKSKPRDRRPTQQELDLLLAYFRKQNEHKRTTTDMVAVTEFSYYSARRISETCRLRWGDVNGADMTCIVRDMKDPKMKKGNDHEFPLLGRAWDIVQSRVSLRKTPENPDERIFPFNSKTCSQRYTLAKKAAGEAASRSLHQSPTPRQPSRGREPRFRGSAERAQVFGSRNDGHHRAQDAANADARVHALAREGFASGKAARAGRNIVAVTDRAKIRSLFF
jgi:integrase